jgi:hypothetical protein
VLLNSDLINDTEQGNISNLYETEVKPLGIHEDDEANKDGNAKPKTKDTKNPTVKGQIMNISSPFKENFYRETGTNSPF